MKKIALLASLLLAYKSEMNTGNEIALKREALAQLLSYQEFKGLPLLFAVESCDEVKIQAQLQQRLENVGSCLYMLPYDAAIANYLQCRFPQGAVGIDIGYEYSRVVVTRNRKFISRNISYGGAHFLSEASDQYAGGGKLSIEKALELIRDPLASCLEQEEFDIKAFFQSMRGAYEEFSAEISRVLAELEVEQQSKVCLFGNGAKITALEVYLNKNTAFKFECLQCVADKPISLFEIDSDFVIPIGVGLRYFEQAKFGDNLLKQSMFSKLANAGKKRVCCVEFGHGGLRAVVLGV